MKWLEQKFYSMTLIEWLGIILGLSATFLVAVNIQLFGWIIWSLATSVWLVIGIRLHSKALILVQAGYLIFDLLGLIRALL